jgi:flagellar biosynthesis anti-sigma factor FlgM
MRISRRNQTGKVGPVSSPGGGPAKADKTDSAAPAGPGGSGLEVSISDKANEVQQAQAAVKNMPDVRVKVVAAIQGEIDQGTYKRDSKKIAKRMVNEALRESIEKKKQR